MNDLHRDHRVFISGWMLLARTFIESVIHRKNCVLLTSALASVGMLHAQNTNFTNTGTIITYTIPQAGLYSLKAVGASGAGAGGAGAGGAGAVLSGEINLNAGTILNIAVGGTSSPGSQSGGGGGGTFIYTNSAPLIIAGGGGGGGSYGASGGAGITNTGGAGTGGAGQSGAGGAGFYGNGGNSYYYSVTGGQSAPYFSGGNGDQGGGPGGWGGGGGSLNGAGGGGGGYNGGNGASPGTGGGGGSSYLSPDFVSFTGTNGANYGNGYFTLTWMAYANLYVGSNSSSQSTNFSDGNTHSYGNTYVGYDSGDSNNQLSVGNTPTLLTNSGDLYVGYAGLLNSMLITNGGAVANQNGWIGYTNTASNNSVLVSDSGSTWTSAGDLTVGADGSGNSLVISNGASVAVTGSSYGIAIGLNSNSSNNSILVTAVNSSSGLSSLYSGSNIIIGLAGSGNSLSILSDTSGGSIEVVVTNDVVLGSQNTSSNNQLLVSGVASVLTAQDLIVGSNGSANSMIISNSAVVFVNNSFNEGGGTSSNNITTIASNAVLAVTGDIYLSGGNGSGNQFNVLGGSLGSGLSLFSDVANGNGPGSNNSILISNSASILQLTQDFFFGSGGQNDALTISDGATVINRGAYLDSATNGTAGNTILVTGAGTAWTNGADFILGQNGSGNLMTISSNATVVAYGSSNGIVIGQNASSSSNSMVVAGSSTLSDGGSGTADLFVGYGGSSNSLTVSDNSLVSVMGASFGTVIGYSNSANNNSIKVTGSSTLTDSGGNWDLFVGYAGSGNSLVISNGSAAIYDGLNYGAVIGLSNTANNNSVTVDASSLTINGTNNASLYVGYAGASNKLTISSGGIVTDTNGYIGVTNGANGNSVLVRDSGTLWTNEGDLTIGVEGGGNSLTVSNGATVAVHGSTNGMVIGFSNTANNNLLRVTGSSTLTDNKNGSSIFVGYAGSSNGLVISGDSVVSGGGFAYGTVIGFSNTAINNFITVTGSSTLTDNNYDADLFVGYAGSSNSLTISSNSLVFYTGNNYGTVIGFSNTANNNTLTVSGSSSLSDDGYSDLYVGYVGSSNRLIISSNSLVSQGGYLYGAVIGFSNTANYNAVSVSGNNALLTNGMDLYVGYGGSSNSLAISGGAQVINSNGWIGYTNGSIGNSVMASGVGTLWSNNGTLTVGNSGSGTLTVNNGASVVAEDGIFIASNNNSIGILNIGGLGGTDGAGSLTSPSITFGSGSGTINFNQTDSVTISAVISGNGAINQFGSGTTILGGNNNYSGVTTITNGALVLSGTNAGNGAITISGGNFTGNGVASNSIVTMTSGSITPGDSGSIGTLSVGRLTITGGTLNIFLSGNTSSLLSVNGDVTLSGGILNFNASSLSGSTYTFLSDTNGRISGSFTTTNNLPTGYELVYASNSVYLAEIAHLGPVTTSFSGTNAIITGGSTNFTVTVTNSAAAGAGSMDFTGTSGTNVSGSIGSTSLAASSATNIIGVFAFKGTNVGANQQGIVTINATNATPSSGSGTVTVNVYAHASGSLSQSNVALQAVHVGYTNVQTYQIGVSNAPGFRVSLQAYTTNSSNNLSLTGVSGVDTNTSSNAVLTFVTGQGVGAFTNVIGSVYGDDSPLAGNRAQVGTNYLTVSGLVYSGQGTWTGSGGDSLWTNIANWNKTGGTPGLDGLLSTNDSATFGSGSGGTVTLNTNAELNAITFSNASNSYTIGGSGVISMVQGSSAPLIEVLAGNHFIENALDLQTNVSFTNAAGAQLTVSGNISGNGGISQGGSGTLVLSGNNSYLGGAVVNAGTLVAGSSAALGSGGVQLLGGTLSLETNLTINSLVWNTSAIVQLLNPTNSIYLTVTDAITLQGSGTNTFDLQGYTPGSSNNPTELLDFGTNALTVNQFGIDNVTGYTLFTSNNALYTYGGSVALIATTSGTTINSTVTYPQVIFQTNGILNVSSAGNLTITTNVVINHNGAINLSGTMTVPNVSVTGGSSLSMLGGTLNGNVTSSGGMTVSGQNAINGNLQLNSLSSLTVGLGSLLNVSGSATLGGSLIIANPVAFGTKQTFLSATTVTGAFDSIIAPAGERGRIVIEGDPTVSVIIAPASYTQMAANQNQVNVATALNSFIPYTSGDQQVVSTSLDSLTASEYNQAFNAIMPTFYQQVATIAFNEANALNMELNQRLWGLRLAEGGGFSMSGLSDNYPMIQEGQGDGGKGVLDAKKDILRPGVDNHWGLFVDGNGIFAQANSANMLPGYNSESGGVTAGVTYRVNPTLSVGAYTGYQGTYTKSGANGSGLGTGSSLTDNAVRFGVFGTYGNKDGKGLYLNALAGGAYHNYQATRVIQYTGMNRTANSQPGAGELDTMLATGYDIQKGKFTFGPTASLQYTYLGVDSLNETGAQSLNYNSSGWNSSSMLSSVGAHAAYNWVAHHGSGGDIVVVPQVSLSWQHEFMQNPYDINGNLGGSSPTFSNLSSTPIRDFLYTGIGFTVEFLKKWNTSFFYNAAAGNQNLTSQNIFWSLGSKF
jgi:T5SS/PEP-CTERM-associated repeat protein